VRRFLALAVLVAAVSVDVPAGAWEGFKMVRTAGADRYGTAAAIATLGHPDGAAEAVVATGESFPDALAGAQLGRPVLLTRRDGVPIETQHALDDLGATRVFVLGGSASISDAVVDRLEGREVIRIAGADRYETAAAVARFTPAGDVALLASGEAFPDALAAGAVANSRQLPLLLTRRDEVPASALDFLTDRGIDEVIVVGGPAAVSDAVLDQLATGDRTATRVAGDDRESTAVALARLGIERWGLSPAVLLLASSRDFPDALAAAGSARAWNAPLLLASGDDISQALVEYLLDFSLDELFGHAFGGTAALSDEVVAVVQYWGRETFPHYWVAVGVSEPLVAGTTPEVIRLSDGTERLFVSGERTRAWETADGTTFDEITVEVPAGTDPAIVPTAAGWRMYLLDGTDVVSATSSDARAWEPEAGVRFSAPGIEDLEAVAAHDGVRLLFTDGDGTRGARSSDGLTFTADAWYLPGLRAPGVVQLANGWFSGTFEREVEGRRFLVKANSYDGATWEENSILVDWVEQQGDNANPTILPIDAAATTMYWAMDDGSGFRIHRARLGPGDG